jgi:hypothetical protein
LGVAESTPPPSRACQVDAATRSLAEEQSERLAVRTRAAPPDPGCACWVGGREAHWHGRRRRRRTSAQESTRVHGTVALGEEQAGKGGAEGGKGMCGWQGKRD